MPHNCDADTAERRTNLVRMVYRERRSINRAGGRFVPWRRAWFSPATPHWSPAVRDRDRHPGAGARGEDGAARHRHARGDRRRLLPAGAALHPHIDLAVDIPPSQVHVTPSDADVRAAFQPLVDP
ncbi:hypothetical protein GCM10017786_43830 [Amycolatopsis deserti]|uniref:Uncharacterized protein n=1 Tax=Amycolatopsis deserti TaxID=185696 RepID=A0ABQ3J6A5_9PSEU|nr:hypothetical protein GCM10017786_43830 [Amycolatopsis deserti]